MLTAKEDTHKLLENLPDNCSYEDIQYHLYILEKIRNGLEQVNQSGVVSHDEAVKRLSQWILK